MEDTAVVDLTGAAPTPNPTTTATGSRNAKSKDLKKEMAAKERVFETRKHSTCWLATKGKKADASAAKEQTELRLALQVKANALDLHHPSCCSGHIHTQERYSP
jgi:hypothetical protein